MPWRAASVPLQELSAYEVTRLDTMRRNHDELVKLGLEPAPSTPLQKLPREPRRPSATSAAEKRHSGRLSGVEQPNYAESPISKAVRAAAAPPARSMLGGKGGGASGKSGTSSSSAASAVPSDQDKAWAIETALPLRNSVGALPRTHVLKVDASTCASNTFVRADPPSHNARACPALARSFSLSPCSSCPSLVHV